MRIINKASFQKSKLQPWLDKLLFLMNIVQTFHSFVIQSKKYANSLTNMNVKDHKPQRARGDRDFVTEVNKA